MWRMTTTASFAIAENRSRRCWEWCLMPRWSPAQQRANGVLSSIRQRGRHNHKTDTQRRKQRFAEGAEIDHRGIRHHSQAENRSRRCWEWCLMPRWSISAPSAKRCFRRCVSVLWLCRPRWRMRIRQRGRHNHKTDTQRRKQRFAEGAEIDHRGIRHHSQHRRDRFSAWEWCLMPRWSISAPSAKRCFRRCVSVLWLCRPRWRMLLRTPLARCCAGDHRGIRHHSQHRRDRFSAMAKLAVVVILHNPRPVPAGIFHERQTAPGAHDAPTGILV